MQSVEENILKKETTNIEHIARKPKAYKEIRNLQQFTQNSLRVRTSLKKTK